VKLLDRILNRLKRSKGPIRLNKNPLELGRLSAWHNPNNAESKSKN